MTRHVQYADAKTVLIDWLTAAAFVAVPRVPNPRPTAFVVVTRVGGSVDSDRTTDRADMAIECWAGQPEDSPAAVWALANQVRARLDILPTAHDGVSLWDEDLAGELYDELSLTPRVIIRGTCYLQPTPA